MYPAPGERFYLDQSARQQTAAIATAEAATIAAQAAAATTIARPISSTVGATMDYSKVTSDLGDLVSTEDAPGQVETCPLPGEFGGALSLVAALSIRALSGGGPIFWWWLATGFGDGWWHSLASPGTNGIQIMTKPGTTGTRLHGPFADRLAIRYCFKGSSSENATIVQGGAYLARITLGVQTV